MSSVNRHPGGRPDGGRYARSPRAEQPTTLTPRAADKSREITLPSGARVWMKGDRRHRLDGPAYIGPEGTQEHWVDGVRHRTDGPAVVRPDGSVSYYEDGLRHRVGGPAVIEASGTVEHYFRGALHRLDGPAILTHDGRELFFVNGRQVDRLPT